MKHLAPIRSLAELRSRAFRDPNYKTLAFNTVAVLDLNPGDDKIEFDKAMKLLEYEAIATSEGEVVEVANSLLGESGQEE